MAIRLGLLSTARINAEILAGARASRDVEVVAVASRERALAEAYAREHGLERAYGGYEQLVGDPDVDAIYNSLPNSLHVPWSLRALEAGKHVLCEKPLTPRPGDAAAVFDAAERARLVLMEGFMYRHHPQMRAVSELVASGAIGRLRHVHAAFSFPLHDDRDIRMRPELDGGALMDVGCYCVSGARLLAGEPEQVFGEQVVGSTGVDVAFHGTMRFAGDVVAQFEASFRVPRRQFLEAVGEDGTLVVGAPWRPDWGGDVLLHRGREVERVDVAGADMYRLELENLAAAVRGEEAPLLGRDDALGQARAIEALYRSAAEGRSVPL